MLADIQTARASVLLEMYIFAADATGKTFRDALVRAAGRSVRVRVIYDALGALDAPNSFFDDMAREGIEVREFNPLSPLRKGWRWRAFPFHRRDHRKLLVVDDAVCYVGGINLADTYLDWEDLALRVEGDVARRAAESFARVWEGRTLIQPVRPWFRPPPSPPRFAVVDGFPGPGFSPVKREYHAGLKKARAEVGMVQSYFLPGRGVRKLLVRLARKGVEVKVIVPAKTDVPSQWYGSQYAIGHLLRRGIRVFRHERGMLHGKYAVVDRSWATVGSANLDPASFYLTLEVNLVVREPEVVGAIRETFDAVLATCRELDYATWRKRPWTQKVLEALFHFMRRMFVPGGG
jgi:cardiolipin synthase